MKEKYFTQENIDRITKEELPVLRQKFRKREIKFNLDRTALIVLDMQNYFLDENSHAFVPSSEVIIDRIKALIEHFTDSTGEVIFTKHSNTKEDAGMMKVWWKDLIEPQSEMSQIYLELSLYAETIIEKHQYDAFYGTSLMGMLKDKEIDTVILCGVMTHLCLESTARTAFVSGLNVIIPYDTTATYNFNLHKSSINSLSHGFANIVSSKALIGYINEK